MPRSPTARAQLLESAGTEPLHARSHYAEWLSQSLALEHLRAEALMGFAGPNWLYGEAGGLPPAAYLPEDRTPFYSLADNGEVLNPTAAELKEAAHRLVGTGLADERTLEGLSFRVTNLEESTPEWLRQAEADHARYSPVAENEITKNEHNHPAMQESSYSYKSYLNIDEAQAAQFPVEAVERTTAVFLHELAHAQHSPFAEELKHELVEAMRGAQTWREDERGSQVALFVGNEVLEQKPARMGFFEKNDWDRVAGEAYADAYMVVAVHAMHGKESALQTLESLQTYRTQEMVNMLERLPANVYFAEGHHTSETLHVLRAFIEDGSVERALAEGRGRDPVLMATAEGLIREFESVRTADLNPHTLGPDGELYSGWPAQLQSSTVLTGIQEEWGEAKFAAMVVVTDEQYVQMQAQGEQLRGVPDSGEPRELQAHTLAAAPGYVFLLSDSLTLEHESAAGVQAYELQSGAQNLQDMLVERFGVERPGAENELADSYASGSGVSSSSGSQGGPEHGTDEVSREGREEREEQGTRQEERAAQAEAQAEAEMEM